MALPTMRYGNLDNVKWILTTLIVLYHIQFRGGEHESLFMAVKNLGDCSVPAFAIISGFLFWRSIRTFADLKWKFVRRIYALLLPYLLWNSINVVISNLPSIRTQGAESLLEVSLWDNVILWGASPHFWYIFMLMFWTVLSPILYVAYRNKMCLCILLSSQIAYMLYKGDSIYHSRYIYMLFTWAGLLGWHFPNLIEKVSSWTPKKKTIVSASAAAVYFSIYWIYATLKPGMGLQVWLYGIRAIALILAAINLPILKIGVITPIRFSFWVFAIHFWCDAYLSNAVFSMIKIPIAYQLVTWSAVMAFSLISGALISKITPSLFSTLTGRRSMAK